jgi:hypothetical protein
MNEMTQQLKHFQYEPPKKNSLFLIPVFENEPAADLVGHLKLNIIIHVIFIEYVMYNRAEF